MTLTRYRIWAGSNAPIERELPAYEDPVTIGATWFHVPREEVIVRYRATVSIAEKATGPKRREMVRA